MAGPERTDDYIYKALLEAVQSGNWNDTKEFLEAHPAALTADILTRGGTVLHAAVEVEQEDIVDELVKMISEGDLRKQDYFGDTALHRATIYGNQRMAECLITKNTSLVSITSNNKPGLPVSLAMGLGHKELARYLYSQTPFEDLARHGASLLFHCIYNRDLDMALDLMERCPRLAFASDGQYMSPLEALAVSTEAFESGDYGMVFWKQWIYNHRIHDISFADLAIAADQFRLNVQNHGQENTTGSVRADLWRHLVSSLFNLLGFKRLYEIKLVRAKFQQLLDVMCRASQRSPKDNDILCRAMFSAIKRGNFEYVHHIIKANPDFLWLADERNMFQWAVLHRQHRIFSLIYSLKQMNVLVTAVDSSRNIMLHMAGMVIENTAIDSIRGAALQMQREVQWFQEVESICPPSHKEKLNKDKLTPRQLFRRDHQNMRKE
ncbi:uncharacterized protein LOC121241516 [Juglans microcarpa x Juglans regia]|uniref:uncharacterized protein LOC121241516 n=1 Tax=Juglans microcarpa x Juglans regia TaxID=2249226 RepID=UPI001B7DAFA9|nr:uncharacterized protein LOC121241516 [Juglans microcarpa x Juglans regia]